MPDVQDPGFKAIESILLQHDAVPLFGGAPAFPVEQFSEAASDLFGVEGLSCSMGAPHWRDPDHFLQGVATPSMPIDVVCGEMEGCLIWLMADHDWDQLMTWLLTKEATSWAIPDTGIREGFLKFATAETIRLVERSGLYGSRTFRLTEHRGLPEEPCLGIDITLEYQGEKATGRLLVTSSFHRSWSEVFTAKKPREISPELANSVEIDVHVEMAKVEVSQEEWANIQPGDCLLLDQSAWDPAAGEGPVALTTEGRALYHGKMNNQGAIEISQVAGEGQV